MDYLTRSDREAPVLSICIPTYNRAHLLKSLLEQLLCAEGPFEVCVHNDGSTDHTPAVLRAIAHEDPRLKATCAPNVGRAQALKRAVANASGAFIMLYDDDDEIDLSGLGILLRDLKAPLPEGVAGFIYQMRLPTQEWQPFPTDRSNFLRLRAEEGVVGDKKEVITAPVLKQVFAQTPDRFRRVPTSLYWAKIAIEYDVLCRNVEVGKKRYQQDGLSANIRAIKIKNAQPIAALNRQRVIGFFKGRYRSGHYLLRSLVAWLGYSVAGLISLISRARSS